MPETDYLSDRFPTLGRQLPKLALASLPTPVREHAITGTAASLAIKYDNLSGDVYGGNKLRKLEYIFHRAKEKHGRRIATFGAVGSNHALATALYARRTGFECTCFLSHQAKSPLVAATLNRHVENGTELVRYGGSYAHRLHTLRQSLWGRESWVIPMGGSSWLGTVGFVAAGLELAHQVAGGEVPAPDKLYVGSGTMGTAAGIALGLAIAGLPTEVNAVRVSDVSIMNPRSMRILLHKTANMMRRLDNNVPPDLVAKTNIRIRHRFFAPGYARASDEVMNAIEFAGKTFGVTLEPTYTGKTMAAILSDLREPGNRDLKLLYWHTFNSVPLGVPEDRPLDSTRMPGEFLRYFS